jgi:hypothetical protein
MVPVLRTERGGGAIVPLKDLVRPRRMEPVGIDGARRPIRARRYPMIGLCLSEDDIDRGDRRAKERGLSRSDSVRALIE